MLVWIASYPRSGNTFFRMALHRLYGCTSSVEPGHDGAPAAVSRPPSVYISTSALSLAEMARRPELHVVKTHSLPREAEHPAFYLLRDGRDALVSYAWFHLVHERGRLPDRVEPAEFRETLRNLMLDRRSPYGVWSEHVCAWLTRPRTAVVRFERLIGQPAAEIRAAVEGLRLPLTPRDATIPGFAELQAEKPTLYRRGRVGSWRDEFPADLLEDFRLLHAEGMARAGYPLDPRGAPGAAADGARGA